METIEKNLISTYVQEAGFETIEAFMTLRLTKRLKELTENYYLLSPQLKYNQNCSKNWTLEDLGYDFWEFVETELILFYQENLQNFRLQMGIFQKKYQVQSYQEWVKNYPIFTEIPENEKDSDEVIWEHIQNLTEDFTLRLNTLKDGIQTRNRSLVE